MPMDYDSTSKKLFDAGPAEWLKAAGLQADGAVSALPTDQSTVTSAVDKAVWVDGQPPWIAHFEFVSSYEITVLPKLVGDHGLLYRRYQMPIECVVVLLSRKANQSGLDGQLKLVLARPNGARTTFFLRYTVVRVWKRPFQEYLKGELPLLPLAVLGQGVSKDNVPTILEHIRQRLDTEAKPQPARDAWAATKVLIGIAFKDRDQISEWFSGRMAMGMEGSVVYQDIKAIGLAEGEAKGIRRSIVRWGRPRLGEPHPEFLTSFEEIEDVDRLDRITDAVAGVASWSELLAIP